MLVAETGDGLPIVVAIVTRKAHFDLPCTSFSRFGDTSTLNLVMFA